MKKIGIIRCEKNEERCPLTNCLKCLVETREGFQMYDQATPAGVFTCRCPGDGVADLARILKAKGADALHFCTCTFARKGDDGWTMADGGFCAHIDEMIAKVTAAVDIPVVKGTAHLPKGYNPRS